jgi:hypothetical protein
MITFLFKKGWLQIIPFALGRTRKTGHVDRFDQQGWQKNMDSHKRESNL